MMRRSDEQLDALLGRAFRRASAAEANAAISQIRAEEGTEGRPALSYEVVLPASNPVAYLTESVLPRLVYFLDCAGFKLPDCPGTFISLFRGEDLFFIRAADAIDELSRLSGLSMAQLAERFGSTRGG